MKKLLIFVAIGLLLFGSGLFLGNVNGEPIINEDKIETGISPEQTWEIILGEDIGEVLNLRKINREW